MTDEINLPKNVYDEVIKIKIHILDKCHFKPNSDKIAYELLYRKLTKINNFKVFGSKCHINNIDDNLGKFDVRNDEGIFLGYFSKSKGYRCYNKRFEK